jgi:hypothetical protein
MAKPILTAEQVREHLNYDPETGIFTRKKATTGRYGRAGAVCGAFDRHGYLVITITSVRNAAHRLAWLYVHGEWPKQQIDHINHVKTDNRIANLRDVSGNVNQQNKIRSQRQNKLGLLGVHRFRGSFIAQITIGGTAKNLGSFGSPEDAHAAYVEAKRRHHEGCTL